MPVKTKIISVVPSITELLYDLGLSDEVLAITKFCIHPQTWFRTKKRIGGTKNLHLDTILDLQPDVIIANKEENVQSQIESLQAHTEVLLTDIQTLADAYNMIITVGDLTGKTEQAKLLVHQIQQEEIKYQICAQKTAIYVIWQDPIMVVGPNTFIHHMMHAAGFINIVQDARYPVYHINDLQALKPDYVLLSSEPYPFTEKHALMWQQLMPQSKVCCVDGELFSWYGSRMLQSFKYFSSLHANKLT